MGGGGADDGGRNGGNAGGRNKRKDCGTRTSITVLLLGDDGVGKSSLVSTYVSRHFSEAVPGVMTRVRLPPDPSSGNCVTTIVDSRGADAALATVVARSSGGAAGMNDRTLSAGSLTESGRMMAAEGSERDDRAAERMQRGSQQLETSTISLASTIGGASSIVAGGIENVDSIVLVYDLDRVETFYRLENHWLPLIERCYNGELPVILAGNKMDLFGQSGTAAAATSDERSLARSRQQIVAILQRFKFVRQCIKCSARNLLNVDEVFLKARQAVLYPITPLYDLDEGRIAPDCRRALARVFRMHDLDHDGLLSDSELNTFQSRAFRVPLAERDLAGWKKVVSKNNPAEEAVVRNGKFTVSGFLAIFDVFIGQNRLEVPWRILRMFGYDDDLNLEIPESITSPVSGDGSGSGIAPWRLTSSARRFLTAVFHQFDSDSDGVLSTDDVLSIFSIVPEPSLPPWHPLRSPSVLKDCFSLPSTDIAPPPSPRSGTPSSPSSGSGNAEPPSSPPLSASGITILSAASLPSVDPYTGGGNVTVSSPGNDHIHTLLPQPLSFLDWMGQWHMISSVSPSAARAELFRLGHVEDRGRKASSVVPVQMKMSGKKKAVSPAADYTSILIPSKELRVLVLGSQGCGKTALINALCTEAGDEPGHLIQARSIDTVKTMRPETSCAYVRLKRPEITNNSKRGKAQEEKAEEFVAHILMTEVPEPGKGPDGQQLSADLASIISKDEGKKRCCDLVLLAFDCNDATSLKYVKEIERTMLSDEVPRVFLGTKADQGSGDFDAENVMDGGSVAVQAVAKEHCAELDLEPPVLTSAIEMNVASCEESEESDRQERVPDVLRHLACSVLSCEDASSGGLRSTPHAEQKRRAAARRRRMMWLGGVVTASVAVAIGVGALWGSKKDGQKEKISWLRSLFRLGGPGTSTTRSSKVMA